MTHASMSTLPSQWMLFYSCKLINGMGHHLPKPGTLVKSFSEAFNTPLNPTQSASTNHGGVSGPKPGITSKSMNPVFIAFALCLVIAKRCAFITHLLNQMQCFMIFRQLNFSSIGKSVEFQGPVYAPRLLTPPTIKASKPSSCMTSIAICNCPCHHQSAVNQAA